MARAFRRRCGYATVLALLILAFIVTLSLSLSLTLTVELRSAAALQNEKLARNHAQMALSLAIGRMQEMLGRDDRLLHFAADGSLEVWEVDADGQARYVGNLTPAGAQVATLGSLAGEPVRGFKADLATGGAYGFGLVDIAGLPQLPQEAETMTATFDLPSNAPRTVATGEEILPARLAAVLESEALQYALDPAPSVNRWVLPARSVLSNSRGGGLQKDFSAWLETGQGMEAWAELFPTEHPTAPAPRFSLIRDFCAALPSDGELRPAAPLPLDRPRPYDSDQNDETTLPPENHAFSPVLVELRHGHGLYQETEYIPPNSEGQRTVSKRTPGIVQHTIIALWNPYAQAIAEADYAVEIATNENTPAPQVAIQGNQNEEAQWNNWMPSPLTRFTLGATTYEGLRRITLGELNQVRFEPGELKVFTLVGDAFTEGAEPATEAELLEVPEDEWSRFGSARHLRLKLMGQGGVPHTGEPWNQLYARLYLREAATGDLDILQELQQLAENKTSGSWDGDWQSPGVAYPLTETEEDSTDGPVTLSTQTAPLIWAHFRLKGSDDDPADAGDYGQRWLAEANPRALFHTRTLWQQADLTNWPPQDLRGSWAFAGGIGKAGSTGSSWGGHLGSGIAEQTQAFQGLVLYEKVPASRLYSFAQLQHANLAPHSYLPGYAVGNALAHPQIPRDLTATAATCLPDYDAPNRESLYDYSYRINEALWDRFFLPGTGTPPGYFEPVTDTPLPAPDFDRTAAGYLLRGGFNVNTATAEAWLALLMNHARREITPLGDVRYNFPRFNDVNAPSLGNRLALAELRSLAEAIHAEAQARAPFATVAEFINRRLTPADPVLSAHPEQGLAGVLQAAIESSGVNGTTPADIFLPQRDRDWLDDAHARGHKGYGLPTHLTQADLLQRIGPFLRVRSDTFRIRAVGEHQGAQAICEVLIQRYPDYADPSDAPWMTGPDLSSMNQYHGRKFRITSFKWLE